MAYYRTLKLNDNEIPAIVNVETGDTKTIEAAKKSNGTQTFDLMPSYHRMNTKAWEVLKTQVTKPELVVAFNMALMAQQGTNSIIPVNDDCTNKELGELLGCDQERVRGYVRKLFDLGVIGKFEVCERKVYKKYWIFNPWLAFNGKRITNDVKTLFAGTTYAHMGSPVIIEN